jgi:hypothetical protein
MCGFCLRQKVNDVYMKPMDEQYKRRQKEAAIYQIIRTVSKI